MTVEQQLYDIAAGINDQINCSGFNDEELQKLANKHRVLAPLLAMREGIRQGYLTEERKKHLYQLLDFFEGEQIDYLMLKGIVASKYYPKHLIRQMSDIDILIKDINHFWKAAAYLLEAGFEYEYIPMICSVKGTYYCVAAFEKILTDGKQLSIEFNVGGFLFSEYFWLNEEELWTSKSTFLIDDRIIYVPNDSYNYFILICEAGGNERFRIRDAVDYHFFSKAEIDQNKINGLLQKYEIKHDEKDLRTLNNLLRHKQPVLKQFKQNRLRTRRFRQLLPALIKRKISIRKSVLQYFWLKSNGALQGEKFVNLCSKIGGMLEKIGAFDRGMMNHLIPLNETKGEMTIYKKGKNRYMVTPAGTFVINHFCFLEKHMEKDAENLIKVDA